MIRPHCISLARHVLLRQRPAALRASWVCASCRSYSTRRSKISEPEGPARTRFAPSPTGFLHLGSLRTALFNYLLAKRTGGQFILRIEDTDQTGHAYRCFCSIDRLRALAERRRALGLTSEYDRTCASIPPAEAAARAADGESHVIRLRVPESYPAYFDVVYGHIKPQQTTTRHGEPAFEDPVLIKQDGLPTYHLANVVDDHLMAITHVVRGVEWMPSTPKHVFMYSAFGWTPPTFCHVGLLQDDSGQKLSKRSGDVHVSEYRRLGYLPDALLNFVALLGWNNRSQSDVLPLEALVQNFHITNLTKGNTKVNFGKLEYLQKAYVAAYASRDNTGAEDFLASIATAIQTALTVTFPELPEPVKSIDYIRAVLASDLKNYVTPLKFVEQHDYLFLPAPNFDSAEAAGYRSKMTGEDVIRGKEDVVTLIKALQAREKRGFSFDDEFIDRMLTDNWDKEAHKDIQRILRYALAGGRSGPGIHRIMMLLGEEQCIKRLQEIRWYGKRGQVDAKGRVIMTWKEPEETPDEDDEDAQLTVAQKEAKMEELIRKSHESR
ncbi:hypothetical protein Dda_2649 [Drechslerella dactyloides]|uniref:Glutamyl-tRNA synthetase n=1 Tax=Drechslerella dactyloides TaxID=74499 RepID=A0AAD6NKZ0_DREDA|nr:hypothetical protein Dda_2649 [Drechslerella dactyloides]